MYVITSAGSRGKIFLHAFKLIVLCSLSSLPRGYGHQPQSVGPACASSNNRYAACGWNSVLQKGFNDTAFVSAGDYRIHTWSPARAGSVQNFPGALVISGVLPRNFAKQYMEAAEGLGFDDAHHPAYQNQAIDKAEEEYRKNDRCVYQATPGQVQLLLQRIGPFLPPRLNAGAYGLWKLWGFNDMWRFYRYQEGQHFPLHRDNRATKRANLTTWFSVLVYLTDDFEGGYTKLHHDGWPSGEQLIKPSAGDGLLFFHMPPFSHSHSGTPPSGGTKYVLRTDALYESDLNGAKVFSLSPPYDTATYKTPPALHVPAAAPEWKEYWEQIARQLASAWSRA